MKIRPATNHSSKKNDYNHFSLQKTERFLSHVDKICSKVYFGIPNST
jgi:hypothetical protein